MERKRALCTPWIVTSLLLPLLLTACSATSNPTPAASPSGDPTPAAVELPKIVNMGTNEIGSLLHTLGSGLSAVSNKYNGMQIKVIPAAGSKEWLPQLASGESHLGLLNNYDAMNARAGSGEFKEALGGQKAPIYLLTAGTPSRIAHLVAADSGIKTCADLKGKRVADTITASAGINAQAKASAVNCGLEKGSYTSVTVPSPIVGVRAVLEGRADASVVALGAGVVTELDAAKGARFISMETSEEAVRQFNEIFPAKMVKMEPGQNRVGVLEPIYMAQYPFYLIASEQLPEEAAYQIVKAIWEHNDEVAVIHAQLAQWNKETMVDENPTIPYHPGTVKFFKEVGVWTPAMDAVQNKLLGK